MSCNTKKGARLKHSRVLVCLPLSLLMPVVFETTADQPSYSHNTAYIYSYLILDDAYIGAKYACVPLAVGSSSLKKTNVRSHASSLLPVPAPAEFKLHIYSHTNIVRAHGAAREYIASEEAKHVLSSQRKGRRLELASVQCLDYKVRKYLAACTEEAKVWQPKTLSTKAQNKRI